jgi:hypothetical protein
MNRQTVEFIETERVNVTFDRPEAFTFRADKKWPRLQRLCLWILRRLGAHDLGERIEMRRHVIHPEDLTEAIYRQEEQILDLFHHRGSRILIGPEEWERFLHDTPPYMMHSFSAPYGHGSSPQLLGMPVTMVPWMKGVLVVPKEL